MLVPIHFLAVTRLFIKPKLLTKEKVTPLHITTSYVVIKM